MSVSPILQKAREYYHSSRGSSDPALEDSYFLASEHLERHPDNKDALELASMIKIKQKLFNDAIPLLLSLTKTYPDNHEAWENLAFALKKTGQLNKALCAINKCIELIPEDASAQNSLGNILTDMECTNDAINAYEKSIELNKKYFPAYVNLSMLLHSIGEQEKALNYIKIPLQATPNDPEVLNSYAIMMKHMKDYDKAIKTFQTLIDIAPKYADAYNNLGLIYAITEDFHNAEDNFKIAISIEKNAPEYYNNYGTLLYNINKLAEAKPVLEKAIELRPNYPDALGNLGNVHLLKGDLEKAQKFNLKALEIDEHNAHAYYNLGVIERDKKNFSKAAELTEKAIKLIENKKPKANALAPDNFYNSLGIIYTDMGEIEKSINAYKKALTQTKNPEIFSNFLLTLHYNDNISNQDLFEWHRTWAKKFSLGIKTIHPIHGSKQANASNRPIRIGYVSGDFKAHSVSFFCRGLIAKHTRSDFKIYCYSFVRKPDHITQETKNNADVWRNITPLTNDEIAQLIYKDEIDILVDLSGHTADNKLPALAFKPAPIQIEYLGYPNTSGLTTMDYRIVDEYTDPSSDPQADKTASETLWRMPNSFICYQPLEGAVPDVAEAPCIKNGYVTFGSFNNVSKICDSVIATWSEILNKTPNSKLILKAKQTSDLQVKDRLLKGFLANGAKKEQIIFISHAPSLYEHLQLYSKVDVALDTFPYNGTTTTCEAMWMGVPTLCLNGDRHSARVGISIVKNVGIDDIFSSYSKEEFIRKAIELSKNPNVIAETRKNLRPKMAKSHLCDQEKYIKELENAYRMMWAKYTND
ncbi:MAG: tetratricopeptide repeat protein [Alphaproteobacteria bacterium]|nr:tetratricopeptide repeat protein [Alphaproteobacteria bacterium]